MRVKPQAGSALVVSSYPTLVVEPWLIIGLRLATLAGYMFSVQGQKKIGEDLHLCVSGALEKFRPYDEVQPFSGLRPVHTGGCLIVIYCGVDGGEDGSMI